MAKGKIKFGFNIKKRILPVIILSVCIPLILFVAIPFEIYANNMDEFLFSLADFFPWCVLFGFLLAACIACGLLFLPERVYRVAYALVLSVSFMLFLQGTFLNFGINSLSGDKLGSASIHIGLKILDLFIWIAVIAAAVVLSLIKDTKGIITIIAVILSIVIVATQIINPLANTVNNPNVFLSRIARLEKENSNFKNEVITCENLTSVASERNIFYFCIDRFDEYFAETAYELQPDIYDNLDGFTWFKDNLSLYGHTFPSIAYMLSGNQYDTKLLRKEYLDTVYVDNNTLSVLDAHGYNVNLYTQAYYAYNTAFTLPDYVKNISVAKQFETTQPMKLLNCMLGTAAIRCLPLFLKDVTNGVKSNTFNECVTCVGENGYDGYSSENDTVYGQAAKATFNTNGDKNFSFIHIEGCHDIYLDYISKSVSAKQKNEIRASVENSLRVVNEYIKVLKERDLYKDATIIITGDHPAPIDDTVAPEGAKLTALFFKRSGYDGTPLEQSNAPVAHENIWPAIMQSEIGENEGTGLFDISENDATRERKYIWHTYENDRCDEYIYTVKGSGRDFANWKLAELNHFDRFIMD